MEIGADLIGFFGTADRKSTKSDVKASKQYCQIVCEKKTGEGERL
jgi:hypothetical protein